MALIKCQKCGKEISDRAKKCVGCGWEVNLGIQNTKEDEADFNDTSSNIYMSHIEDERKKMLIEAELEIEKMKEDARKKIELMNDSAKVMASQKQKELELEYKKERRNLFRKKNLWKRNKRN